MATTDLYGQYTNPATPEILGLERQREYARQLMQMSAQPQGGMVSGRYVAPAFTQQLQAALNPVIGALMSTSADKKALQIAERLREKEAEDVNKFYQYQYGSPSQQVEMAGPYGAGVGERGANVPMPTLTTPEIARNPQMAYQIAATSQSPILRQQLAEILKGKTVKEGETVYRYNPLTGKDEPVVMGGETLPSDLKSIAIRLGLPRDSSKWTDEQRKLVDTTAKAEKGPPVTNLVVNTGKAYTGAFGEGIAKEDLSKYSIAEKAPSIYQNALNTEDLIKKGAITGLGAEFKLNLARTLNVAGANNADIIRNTEQLVANRGQIVLDSIKASGLGAGQGFTNTDRQFLEKVKGGTIELNAKTLLDLARIEKNVAKASVDAWNKRLPNIPKEAIQGTGVGPVQLQQNQWRIK